MADGNTIDSLVIQLEARGTEAAVANLNAMKKAVSGLQGAVGKATVPVKAFSDAMKEMGAAAKAAKGISKVLAEMDSKVLATRVATEQKLARNEKYKAITQGKVLKQQREILLSAEKTAAAHNKDAAALLRSENVLGKAEAVSKQVVAAQNKGTAAITRSKVALDKANVSAAKYRATLASAAVAPHQALPVEGVNKKYTQYDQRKAAPKFQGYQELPSLRPASNIAAPVAKIKPAAVSASQSLRELRRDITKMRDETKKAHGPVKSFTEKLWAIGKVTGSFAAIGMAAGMVFRTLETGYNATIKKQMDFIETLNLFEVAMGQNTDRAYEFVNAFSGKLGYDPNDLMNTQATLYEMTNSMGVATENSYKMSQGMTQLAYDLASFRNIPIDQVMQNVQSGLAGEARAMRRYGIDITQAALQETALSMGITKHVQTMTQAEKAQLRYVTIMRSSTNAQGDMARTLYQPANLMRVLGDQVTIAARNIGALFIPMIQAMVPYLITAANAVGAFAAKLAKAFGFKLPEIITPEISLGMDDAESAADGIASGMGAAADAAKKMKDYTLGIDELNVLAPPDASAGGGGGGAGGVGGGGAMYDIGDIYPALGDKNPLQDMMDKVKDSMSGFFDALRPLGDALKIFFTELGSIAKWVFEEVITPVFAWFRDKIAPRLVETLTNLVNLATPLLQALGDGFIMLWRDYIEPMWVKLQPIIEGIWDWVNGALKGLTDWVTANREPLAKMFEIILGVGIGLLVGGIALLIKHWDTMREVAAKCWDYIKEAAISVWEWMKSIWEPVGKWFSDIWSSINDAAIRIWDNIKSVVVGVWNAIKNAWGAVGGWFRGLWDNVKSAVGSTWDWVKDKISGVWTSIKNAWGGIGDFFGGIWQSITNGVEAGINKMIGNINKVLDVINDVITAFNKVSVFPDIPAIKHLTKVDINRNGSISEFARGGHPQQGSLFLAGEAGPELLGSHRGKTTVMPLENTSFVSAVGKAVYSAVVTANDRRGDDTVIVNLDGVKVGQGIKTATDRRGGGANPQFRMV